MAMYEFAQFADVFTALQDEVSAIMKWFATALGVHPVVVLDELRNEIAEPMFSLSELLFASA